MPERHIQIIIDGEDMAARGARIVKVASYGGALVHEKCQGWEDWDAELEILEGLIATNHEDLDTQLSTLEAMMPSD